MSRGKVRAPRTEDAPTRSAIKRKFGEMVRSKADTAQRNEVLCEFGCQNVTCLIAAVYELGLPILPGVRADDGPAGLKFPGVA